MRSASVGFFTQKTAKSIRPNTAQSAVNYRRAMDKNHALFYMAVEKQRRGEHDSDLESLHHTIEAKMERAKQKRYELFKDVQIRLRGDLVMRE